MGKKEDQDELAKLDAAAVVPSVVDPLSGIAATAAAPAASPATANTSPAPAMLSQACNSDRVHLLNIYQVSFVGPNSDAFAQPIPVRALDGSEAWSQVVRQCNIDGSRCHPTVKLVGPASAVAAASA